ncbi:ROK family transcriptional regulator [Streptomyces rimosus]|uniref:ROK family transcriptional regulator n=1 Tax=Streptomyces rimosus TaxID=1927 RepID=UPI0004CB6A8D|nr:ROK family transcriptional regulator [Streptomyces rimosus]
MTARPANAHQERVLKLLRDEGPRSRAELSGLIDLSRSKVAVEVDRLMSAGLLVVDGLAASRGGRRSHRIRLSPELRFLGVDIGATSVDVAVTNAELEVLGHLNEPIDVREGPVAVFEQVVVMAGKLKAAGLAESFDGAGVGIPGPVRFAEGVPVAPPIMPGWDGFPVRKALSQVLGCPVMVDNDVNLMALGERHAGVAKRVDDFLCVKIGTGIGCGIVVNGQVHRGASGSAGDIGHIQVDPDGHPCACGNRGCLEAHFSGAALARDALAAVESGHSTGALADRLAASGTLTAADVGAAANVGDAVALDLIRAGGDHVGHVIAGLVSFFNPSLVVLGGRVTGLGHGLLAAIRTQVYRRSLPLATGNLPIVLGDLGPVAGAIGAARLITDHLFSPA